MKSILLVITPERQSTEALHWCLHKVKETGLSLKVTYVVEENGCRDTAKKKLEEIERQCRTFQVPFETSLHEGAYLDACGELASKNGVDILVVTEKKGPFYKQWFLDSEASQIQQLISCEIRVY